MRIADLNVQGLKDRDFVRLTKPAPLAFEAAEAHAAWQSFYELPEGIKKAFGYQPDALKSGVGYQSSETGRDPKEHFHVRLSETEWLYAQAHRLNDATVYEFLDASLGLARAITPFARDFVQATEQTFTLPNLTHDTMVMSETWTFRFLHYHGGCESGDIIAAKHVDKGGFTAHLFESDTGFERFRPDGIWEPVAFGVGETAIIAGLGLQYRSKCELPAMLHRVVANERTAREGRDSIVCFFDFEGAAYYNKEENGPTQGLPDDFNRLPFEKFRTYFVEP